MALGGQGAPLVPAFHHAVLMHPTERRMVLNIGGIANLSLLIPGQELRGYDTGPGNMLLDAWIWRQQGKAYDKDGAWAAAGNIVWPLLQQMLGDPYFALHARKAPGVNTSIWAGLRINCHLTPLYCRRIYRRR